MRLGEELRFKERVGLAVDTTGLLIFFPGLQEVGGQLCNISLATHDGQLPSTATCSPQWVRLAFQGTGH